MDRKIMIEVTHEEYEKIMSGALDISCFKTDDIINEILKRTKDRKSSENPYTGKSYIHGKLYGDSLTLDYACFESGAEK